MFSNNVSQIIKKQKCVGCMACVDGCPSRALSSSQNERGFYCPSVDVDRCTNCGLCLKICPFSNESFELLVPINVYACRSCDRSLLLKSSSGGMFYELARCFLNEYENAAVYGAAFDDKLIVRHVAATNSRELAPLVGSKYVQSDVSSAIHEIATSLKNRHILFVGTPCQCYALKTYLSFRKIPLKNLLIVDVLCHGVPSPDVWKGYISELEKKYKKKIVGFSFRNKNVSWEGINPIIFFDNGFAYGDGDWLVESYAKLFGKICLNSPCFSCAFSDYSRVGDFSLGDFWRIKDIDHGIDCKLGISRLSVNSSKGMEFFEKVKKSIEFFPVDDGNHLQNCLVKPTKRNILDSFFWKDFLRRGYSFSAYRYTSSTLIRVKNILKNVLRKKR